MLPDDFIVTAVGHSMEPTIRHNSQCVFRQEPSGENHDNRIILAQVRADGDPEYGGRYAVKRLRWKKGQSARRLIQLDPDNDAYQSIRVRAEHLRVVGVYLRPLVSA